MKNQMQSQDDASRLSIPAPLLQAPAPSQQVLFVRAHEDDLALLGREELLWLDAIRSLDWRPYRRIAALYYQALWDFNQAAAADRAIREAEGAVAGNPEEREQATLRLLHERPTGGSTDVAILHPTPAPPARTPMVREKLLEPGVVPFRLAGREPKDFFAMFKAFMALHLMGKAASAEAVHELLTVSPPTARACGFTIPEAEPHRRYRRTDVPSLRKLEQFDQIMSARGLWSEASVRTVRDNLADGTVNLEKSDPLIHDTTHYPAYSAMAIVEVPSSPEVSDTEDVSTSSERPSKKRRPANNQRKRRERREAKRKSQSRTVKNCRCPDRASCPHPWEQSDLGAGTVVKGGRAGGKRMYWAHKAAVLSLADGIPLDVVAMTDAASHDSRSLAPHLERFFGKYPELRDKLELHDLLADSAYDDDELKELIAREFGLLLRTPVNPRGRKPQVDDLPRGMDSLSPAGTLTCQAGEEMNYRGARWDTENFLYGPPATPSGAVRCATCPVSSTCCRKGGRTGRHVAIPFDRLPHIAPHDPPMARRFKALMSRRPAIERAIKRIKLDLGDAQLTRRGNDAFQAHLDRSLLAFHLLLRVR